MIDIIKKRRLWYTLSILLIGVGLVFMVENVKSINHIFNLGIDFTGGTSISIQFKQTESNIEERLTQVLSSLSLDKHIIQIAEDNNIIIKLEELDALRRNQLFKQIEKKISPFEVLEVDIIGPSIGEELKKTSLIIIIAVSLAILMYCSWRFDLVFGFASIIALIHDVFILIAITSIFKLEVNTAFVAALLTVLGYSINDTIVIFDRIRSEINATKNKEGLSKSLLNKAVNDMLPRSLHTSITTGLVIFSIYILGGISLKVFSLVLLVGLATGTYSSIFIASPIIITVSKLKGVNIVK